MSTRQYWFGITGSHAYFDASVVDALSYLESSIALRATDKVSWSDSELNVYVSTCLSM